VTIETWPLERIKPYPQNARKIPPVAVQKVAASLREFGWQQPIVVDRDGVIVVGHVRRLGALENGWTEAPVHVATNLTPAQTRAYGLADNRSHEEAGWDRSLLNLELADLSALSFDLSLTGFGEAELSRLLPRAEPEDTTALLEKADELLRKWKVERGQVWEIAKHRLMCGDCLDPSDVARAVGDHKPFIMVSDPPYGVELDMEWRDRAGHNDDGPASRSYMKIAMNGKGISGDTRADWSEAYELVPSIDVIYLWYASAHTVEVLMGLERIGFEIRQQIIWSKTVAAMSRSAYHWKHEPCAYAVRKGKSARWVGGREQYTVWEAASPKQIFGHSKEEKLPHPTQKPISLMRIPIANHGQSNDVVFDPFAGSGTTMAAAELENRICCCIEIEPRYCAVILERMATMGLESKLEVARAKRTRKTPS
jgi:DNA modification methylase